MSFSRFSSVVAVGLLLLQSLGCAAVRRDEPRPRPGPYPPPDENFDARALFNRGVAAIEEHDRSGWTPEACEQTSKLFLQSGESIMRSYGKTYSETSYNAGVALHRCNQHAEARKLYSRALEENPKNHRARVQLVRIDLASGQMKPDAAITQLRQAIDDAQWQNPEALVELARLQMRRASAEADSDGPDDLTRSRKNLLRALAVDDGYMPAYNLLSIYYLERVRKDAGVATIGFSRAATTRRIERKGELDLAHLVASQGAQKNPRYAPIFNTLGLIAVESGDHSQASRAFQKAFTLDPSFFEAHVNYASINLGFRGFEEAEKGFRKALELRPNDYEARLGLALALRGRIDGSSTDESRFKAAEEKILEAEKIDPGRPEAFFNHAVLVESFQYLTKAASPGEGLEKAIGLYEEFVKRARGKAEFAKDVEDVIAVPTKEDHECMGPKAAEDPACKRGRIYDLKEMISFNKAMAKP